MNAPAKIAAETAVEVEPAGLALLRKPFTGTQISKLPKETGTQAKQRKADQESGKWPAKCDVCGNFHHPKAVHLDYVGHAAATDRLLDADIKWTWEPVAYTPEGLPAFDRTGGLWIKLTVQGVTRLGYGSADGKTGGDAVKEIIGDALRNAGMRFGMALDLWHKGDLHAPEAEDSADEPGKPVWVTAAESAIIMLRSTEACADWYRNNIAMLKTQDQGLRDDVLSLLKRQKAGLAMDEAKAKTRAGPTDPPTDDTARFHRNGSAPVAGSNGHGADDPFGPDNEIPY